ncbi:Chromate resistance protein ChrB [Streptacidiphilus sp. MAP5-3]|uniref:Chromate resistance protein ChrB n=1 Tax=unclassified Streptacidiphilus TaxID=2643834 RepID=UPI003513E67F
MADAIKWLLLSYRIPTEPTRLRAGVWRRLKALGAMYLQNAVAVLPASPEAERALRLLRQDIIEMGGSAQVLRAEALAGEDEVVGAFNTARDEEYAELLGQCRDFLAEIETETAEEHFTYAELEENDEDLAKLRTWLDKIRARDQFGAARQNEAVRAVQECGSALEHFAERVYAVETAKPNIGI